MSNNKPITQAVYDGIYEGIVNGDITTNDILTEGKLCERYGASKSPIREALVMLCSQNILQSIPRTGYRLLQIMPKEVEDLLEAREALELYLLEKTIRELTPEKLAKLTAVHEDNVRDEQERHSVRDNWRRNMAFHLALASLGDNALLLEALRQLLQSCERAATQYFQGRKNRGEYEELHIPLLKAMEDRDTQTACAILRRDIHQLL